MTLAEAQGILDLGSGFTGDDLKRAFRKKALHFHPDVPTGSKEKFQRLQVAKEVAEYHLSGKSSRPGPAKDPKRGFAEVIRDGFVKSIATYYVLEDLDRMETEVLLHGSFLLGTYPWLVGGVTRYIQAARQWKKRDRALKLAYAGTTMTAVVLAGVMHTSGLMLIPLYVFMIWRHTGNLRWIRARTIKDKPVLNDFLK